MTSYESEFLLIAVLFKYGISARITEGGVTIVYKRHQRKTMTAIFNAMRDNLSLVTLHVYLKDYNKKIIQMYVLRYIGKPISVSHKNPFKATWARLRGNVVDTKL